MILPQAVLHAGPALEKLVIALSCIRGRVIVELPSFGWAAADLDKLLHSAATIMSTVRCFYVIVLVILELHVA